MNKMMIYDLRYNEIVKIDKSKLGLLSRSDYIKVYQVESSSPYKNFVRYRYSLLGDNRAIDYLAPFYTGLRDIYSYLNSKGVKVSEIFTEDRYWYLDDKTIQRLKTKNKKYYDVRYTLLEDAEDDFSVIKQVDSLLLMTGKEALKFHKELDSNRHYTGWHFEEVKE